MIRAMFVLICLAAPATAQDVMRPQEATRLENIDQLLGPALREALNGGSRGDVDWLQEAMAGPALPPLATTLAGDWNCRTMKLGGLLPLVVYANFKCRFTADGDQFVFEKLTGSQRTSGHVQLIDKRMIYLGVGYVASEEPVDYASLPQEDTDNGLIDPQVAIVEQTSDTTARMLFPAPARESLFNLLYLTR